jgi:hypothetical protein
MSESLCQMQAYSPLSDLTFSGTIDEAAVRQGHDDSGIDRSRECRTATKTQAAFCGPRMKLQIQRGISLCLSTPHSFLNRNLVPIILCVRLRCVWRRNTNFLQMRMMMDEGDGDDDGGGDDDDDDGGHGGGDIR